MIPNRQYRYRYCNLLDFDEELFGQLAKDTEVSFLMVTAGFGRVADLEYLHSGEIENLIRLNNTWYQNNQSVLNGVMKYDL